MKLKTVISLLSLTCCFGMNAEAQENTSRLFRGQSTGASEPTPRKVIVVPERMKHRYAPGEAPFYIQLRTYSLYLKSAFTPDRFDRELIIEAEASSIGVPTQDLEKLSSVLSKMESLEQDAYNGLLAQQCATLSKESSVSSDQAREMVTRLEPSDETGAALASTILVEVSTEFGEDVSEAVTKRISEWGDTLNHTRTSTVDFADLTFEGDFQKFLQAQCESAR